MQHIHPNKDQSVSSVRTITLSALLIVTPCAIQSDDSSDNPQKTWVVSAINTAKNYPYRKLIDQFTQAKDSIAHATKPAVDLFIQYGGGESFARYCQTPEEGEEETIRHRMCAKYHTQIAKAAAATQAGTVLLVGRKIYRLRHPQHPKWGKVATLMIYVLLKIFKKV